MHANERLHNNICLKNETRTKPTRASRHRLKYIVCGNNAKSKLVACFAARILYGTAVAEQQVAEQLQ